MKRKAPRKTRISDIRHGSGKACLESVKAGGKRETLPPQNGRNNVADKNGRIQSLGGKAKQDAGS
jgi:hypothetical protein